MAPKPLNLLCAYLFLTLPLSRCPFAAAHDGDHDHEPGSLEYPTVVEIDLVFPRHNATYKPTSAMPIVFAFQNFTAVNNFSYFFQWHLSNFKRKTSLLGTLNHGVFNTSANEPVPEPFLVVNHTGDALLDRGADSRWFLGYEFGYMASCNATDDGKLRGRVGPPITLLEGLVSFTVADNGTVPDIAATGPCAGALGNFDVLGHVNATGGTYDCPVLAEDASTTVTYGTLDKPEDGYVEEDINPVYPCGVKVDATLARNISDILLKARCIETGNTTGDCAAFSAAVRGVKVGGMAVVTVVGSMLMAVGAGSWFLF
ncbi:hypothetical protein GQ53DRAFT_768273 [Thozetella sp. PMI_491]|nr:hypothetical protein GQ53DRAFT_768273 [Thozetella sp. PMI_491]